MSNVYSVGNNRQLIIYNAGSNIFLRVAHFGGPYFNKIYSFSSYLYVYSITEILNVQHHYILSMLCTSIALVTVLPIPITALSPLTWITSYSS